MAKTIDLRTYVLLERAFVRRLQRSWRIQSAPTYAAITKACIDHKWDEARRLVGDLDMTEVGTENREWITYMLLSCAVFGAGIVAKHKPSFVGVGSFDTFLKQVTNNMLQYLEYTGTARVQKEALQSIAEDEAKTKALKREYVRDEKGQFAETGKQLVQRFLERAQGQHRVEHEDYQPVRVTTNPHQTRFVLPDGTRIKPASLGMEHSDAAFEALSYEGHTEHQALTKLMEAGVIRYNKGMGGIQLIGSITGAQAELIADDWNIVYNEALYVDSIQMKDGKPDYEGSRTQRLTPPFTADALRHWINHPEVRKWDTVEKYDPAQLRDEKGRWAKGGKAGALATDLGNTFLHGTAQGFLDDILRNGIRGDQGGKIHPTDRRNRPLALPGHVYMTTDLEEAKEYAKSAGLSDEFFTKRKETVLNPEYMKGYPRVPQYQPSYDAGTKIGGGLPCVVTVELPPEVVAKLRKDQRSDILTPSPYAEGGGKRVLSDYARSYKGDIKPEWIKSITYMTTDLATAENTWHTIAAKDWKTPGPTTPPYLPQPPGWEVSPEWQEYLKTAAEGTVFYIPLKIPVQLIAPVGIGGITRKFDEAKHPRDKDGRFIEASQPRIFHRPSDIGSYNSWGETRWGWLPTQEEIEKFGYPSGQPTGRLLTGEPIPRDQIPSKLYHVTTNAPAVESSGVLLGLLESGGLGGGQEKGVSFTSSKEDAVVIQRELRRAVLIARGDVDIAVFKEWAEQDELMAGLPKGSLDYAVDQAQQSWDGNSFILDKTYVQGQGYTDTPLQPEVREEKRRSLMKDALNSYLWARETASEKAAGKKVPLLKNPILFSDQKLLAKLKPEHVQILESSPEDIPAEALVTTGSDKFLHEVRVYADVPRRRKKAREYVREPAGTSEGGQFAQTRQGARAALQEAVGENIPVGVDDHPTAIDAAHRVAAVLHEMRAKGYEMPTEIEVRAKAKKYPSGEAEDRGLLAINVPDHLPDDMTLDEAYNLAYGEHIKVGVIEDWKTREIRKYTGDSFRDLVVHEMGHINRRAMNFKENLQSAEEFKQEMAAIQQFERQARLHVSEYAATNPDEFVAEVFTLLYNGKSMPPETLQVYDALRGGKIR